MKPRLFLLAPTLFLLGCSTSPAESSKPFVLPSLEIVGTDSYFSGWTYQNDYYATLASARCDENGRCVMPIMASNYIRPVHGSSKNPSDYVAMSFGEGKVEYALALADTNYVLNAYIGPMKASEEEAALSIKYWYGPASVAHLVEPYKFGAETPIPVSLGYVDIHDYENRGVLAVSFVYEDERCAIVTTCLVDTNVK